MAEEAGELVHMGSAPLALPSQVSGQKGTQAERGREEKTVLVPIYQRRVRETSSLMVGS